MALMQMMFNAQTTAPPGWSPNIITQNSQNGTTSPGLCNIYYRRSIIAWAYTAAEIQAATGKTSGTISGLRFYVVGQPLYQPLPFYTIGMKNGTFGESNPGNTGYTTVKPSNDESFSTGTTKEFSSFIPFTWTGQDLAITVAWGQCPTGWNSSGVNYTGTGTMWYTQTDNAGAYLINNDSATTVTYARPVVQLYI